MSRRVVVHRRFRDRIEPSWSIFEAAGGPAIALSGTTETRRVGIADLDLHLKRYRYSLRRALAGALRNTFLRSSRAAREYGNLVRFSERLGGGAVAAPVAYGERRVLGLLREAFLATETVPGAVPLDVTPSGEREAAIALGGFLARLRRAGLVHGSLYARNLLAAPGGGFRLVDLDRAGPGRDLAPDLARLDESLPGVRRSWRLRALRAFLGEDATREAVRSMVARIDAHREAARARLARRNREAGAG